MAALLVLLVVASLTVHAARARGAEASRCDRFAAASVARAQSDTGSGRRVVVIGDSWSAGLGLADPATSWPSRLPGTVHVAGFSGSGFSRGASPCGDVSFAGRARSALRGGADLVVVEGGLNDFDQPAGAIRAGFRTLMTALRGHRVVVVGPADAPSRARAVPRVDALLADLAAAYDVPYVRTVRPGPALPPRPPAPDPRRPPCLRRRGRGPDRRLSRPGAGGRTVPGRG